MKIFLLVLYLTATNDVSVYAVEYRNLKDCESAMKGTYKEMPLARWAKGMVTACVTVSVHRESI
jgi:hypothetical protein